MTIKLRRVSIAARFTAHAPSRPPRKKPEPSSPPGPPPEHDQRKLRNTRGSLVFRSFAGAARSAGRSDAPGMARSVILEGEGESIDGSCTTLVRVIRRCFPAPPYRARWPISWPCSDRALPHRHSLIRRPACWSDRADPPSNGVWNAHRRRAGSGVASQPRTPIIQQRPLVE